MNSRKGFWSRTALSLTTTLVLCHAVEAPLGAQQPDQGPRREHLVRRGDTLWDLARSYLSNPFLWPRIYEANRDSIRNPHWIYPNQRFLIPGLSEAGVVVTPEGALAVAIAPAAAGARSRFYNPPRVNPEDTAQATLLSREPVAPYAVQPAEYASAPWLADTASLDLRGRLERLVDPAGASDRLPSRLHPNDRVYVGRLRGAQPVPGDTLYAVRFERRLGDFGRVVLPLALLVVDSVGPEAAIARVQRQYGTAMIGDPVIAGPGTPPMPRGAPAPVVDGPAGQIIDFREIEPLYGTTDIGFINLGRADGIGVGDELVAELAEARSVVSGDRLAGTRVATFVVVRADEQTSTVRVLGVENTAVASGQRVRVVRQMQ